MGSFKQLVGSAWAPASFCHGALRTSQKSVLCSELPGERRPESVECRGVLLLRGRRPVLKLANVTEPDRSLQTIAFRCESRHFLACCFSVSADSWHIVHKGVFLANHRQTHNECSKQLEAVRWNDAMYSIGG